MSSTADPNWKSQSVPDHDHPFTIPGIADLVQLAEALGGGTYPGLGSGQNDSMPLLDNVAPNFPLNLNFVVPANQVQQQKVALTFQPQPFRNYTSTTGAGTNHAHGGDTISTINIDHGHGTTNELSTHKHQVPFDQSLTGTAKGAVNWETGATNWGNAMYAAVDPGLGIIMMTGADGGTSGDHAHTANNNGGSTLTSHVHTSISNTGGEASHTHSGSGAISQTTSPDAMHVLVDGTDVTSALGGPFSTAQTELDVTKYVAPGSGIHTVQVTSTTNLGRIIGWVRNSSIVNTFKA